MAADALSIGTLNVQTLTGRIGLLASLMEDHRLNFLALQETRIPQDSVASMQAAAHKLGLTLHAGQLDFDVAGRSTRGTAILVRNWQCV